MALKGGYQLVNLKLKEFDSTIENSYKFPELYFDIQNSHSKMTIISGLALDGVKYNDYEVIFYEEEIDDAICYQCILRRLWDTKNYKCITKYLTVYPNDIVKTHKDEFVYEVLPDNSLSLTSTNAVQNKIITKKLNYIEQKTHIYGSDDETITTESWGPQYGEYRGYASVDKIGSICEIQLSGFSGAGGFYQVDFGSFENNKMLIGGDEYKISLNALTVVHFSSSDMQYETIYECHAVIVNNKLRITFNSATGSDIHISSEGDYINMYFPIYKV